MTALVRWVIVMLVACNDIGAITIDDYDDAIHDTACSRAIRCGTIANRDECQLPNVFTYKLDARFVDAVKDGRIAWDAVAAHECVEEWLAEPCDWTSEEARTSRCPAITRGVLVEGDTCLISSECVSNECWNEGCYEACCAGVCVGNAAPIDGAIGEPCRTSGCVEGYCDGSICQPFVEEGGACEWLGQCAFGLACKGRRCMVLPGAGEACLPSNGESECRELGDHCSPVTYRCEPRGHAGAPCLEDGSCGPLYRCRDQRCTLARAKLGERCEYNYDCETPGAMCSVFEGCILPRVAGDPCSYFAECESQICNYETYACTTLEGCL